MPCTAYSSVCYDISGRNATSNMEDISGDRCTACLNNQNVHLGDMSTRACTASAGDKGPRYAANCHR